MAGLAVVTGASAGLGREFARIHARKGGDLVISARREAALQALKQELEAAHGISCHVVACDLGAEGGAQTLIEAVEALGVPVEVLINNAGFGGAGQHVERALAGELAMIDLNVKALVALTHHFGRVMAGQGGGRILNVGSTAGFMPGPGQAVYFATKAFVNSYSQAVDHELRGRGVRVTVLAPGYVETEFADVADMRSSVMVKAGGADAATVAEIGYRAMERGELVRIDRRSLSIALGWIVPLLPRRLVLWATAKTQAKG